jgi:uncharacterized protein YbjT (DUF2867 family)
MTADSQKGRTLVIGATGSIGRLVVRRLAEHGERPVALSRDHGRAQQVLGADVDVVVGDVTDPTNWSPAIQGVTAVVMTHGAPYGSRGYEAIDYGAIPAALSLFAGQDVRVALMTSIRVTGTAGPSRELLNWKHRGERLLRASGAVLHDRATRVVRHWQWHRAACRSSAR